MFRKQARHAGNVGAVRKFIQRCVALAQRNDLLAGLEDGKEIAKSPDATQVDIGVGKPALAPNGFQLLRIGRRLFLVRIGDFEQITAMCAAKILAGTVVLFSARDAAKTEGRWAHARRRSGKRRHEPYLFFSSQILVGLVDPIGSRRIEDIEVDCVFHGFGLMRHVGRNAEHLAGVNHDFFAVNPELKSTIKDIGQLLVVVAVLGHDASLLQQHARHHDLLSDDKLPLQEWIEFFEGNCVPGNVLQDSAAACVFDDGALGAGV